MSLEQLKSALAKQYEIEREIGQGGMATVYLARDVRHERKVAVKVLNPELGAVLGVERFLAEIRVTANLQHPNLLPLFDSGEAQGQLFYVMPYVDGESLRSRLDREKQLPIDEAVRIAIAVGSALDYAHRHGVIHRDLKPENILLLEGHPLVADFGIALAVSIAGGTRVTQTGISLGTPQYMSPEQATGDRVIDGRTDIYSLGAVLYEMLTGDPPHTGSTAQAIIAKVITDKPRPLRLSRDSVPRHVAAAVDCALAKLPADRFATAQDFVDALRGTKSIAAPADWTTSELTTDARLGSGRRPSILALLPWAVAAAMAVIAAVLWLRPSASSSQTQIKRYVLTLPDSARLRSPPGLTVAIAPDGSRIAYSGGPESSGSLFIRDLADLDAKPVRGTDRGLNPTFSPDGRSLLFAVFAGQILRIPIEGGTPVVVADSANMPSWTPDGTILFVRGRSLYRMNAAGGGEKLVARVDTSSGISRFTWPRMLPGGNAALVTINRALAPRALGLIKMDTGELIDLGVEGTFAWYVPTGHIVFGRAPGVLYAAPFDLKSLRITGAAVPLVENVLLKPTGAMDFGVSDNGTMIYRSGLDSRTMVIVDDRGKEQATFGGVQYYVSPRFSPDSKRVAVAISNGVGEAAMSQVWVYDRQSTTLTRVADASERPEWTPDGKSVLTVRQEKYRDVAIQPWDGSGEAHTYTSTNARTMEFSTPKSGHGYLAVRIGVAGRGGTGSGGTSRDIWIAPVDSPKALRPFLATPADEYNPAVSPDGRLLAYVSDESGRAEIYVRPVPGPGGRVQISANGGTEPEWSPTGQTVFYRDGSKFVAADLTGQGGDATVKRRVLFDDVYASGISSLANYSVAPDGKHFLFIKPTGENSKLVLTENWFEDVRRRMAKVEH